MMKKALSRPVLPCVLLGGLLAASGTALAQQQPVKGYRELPQLTVQDDVLRPLSIGFTSRSILPWFGPDEASAILIANHSRYFPTRTLLYRQAGKDGSGKAFALPADYPVYRGVPFDSSHLDSESLSEPAKYDVVKRQDGLFDLIHLGTMDYYRNVGEIGSPAFEKAYNIKLAEKLKFGTRTAVDVNGDGIPDLLISGMLNDADKFNMYPDWPVERGPWTGNDHPNMGSLPDTDIQNFRGYDVAGNWMGMPVRKYLWWAKGTLNDKGEIQFGAFKPVRYGSTDYRVQWQNLGTQMSSAVMEIEGEPYIILMAGVDEILALPLRGEDEQGELRVGKAQPLLKNNGRIQSGHLANIVGLGDFNGDGFEDIVIGAGTNGRLTILSGKRVGEFEDMGNIFTLGGPIAGDTLTVPARYDWDGDGYPDIILGDASGIFSLWRGTEDALVYQSWDSFHTPSGPLRHRPVDGNIQGEVERAWSYGQPTVFDWDGDGHADLITNDNEAKLFLYRGTGEGALLQERERFMLGDKPLPLAWRHRPAVVEGRYGLAGDGRNCLIFMTWDRKLAYAVPEANGSVNIERITELTYEDGSSIIQSGPVGLSGRVKYSVADWDGDGVWDIVFGIQQDLQRYFRLPDTAAPAATPYWMRNVGTNAKPVFEPARMITHKDGSPIITRGHDFNVFPTNLNGDGKLDIIFGDDEGFIFYLMRENLAWDESVEQVRSVRAEEAAARRGGAFLGAGILAEEGWDYQEGSLAAVAEIGGKGWVGPWLSSGPRVEIRRGKLLRAGLQGVFLYLSGEGKGSAQARRLLAQPFSLEPSTPVRLEYQTAWQRMDNANNQGGETVTLMDFCSIEGKSLLAAGTASDEMLFVRIGAVMRKAPYAGMGHSGSGYLLVEVDLEPSGKPLRVRATASDRPITKPVRKWDLEVEGNLEGVVGSLGLSTEKYSGHIGIDGLVLEVR